MPSEFEKELEQILRETSAALASDIVNGTRSDAFTYPRIIAAHESALTQARISEVEAAFRYLKGPDINEYWDSRVAELKTKQGDKPSS